MSEGSIYKRKGGKWCAKYKDASGKWKYLYRKPKAEAKAALRQALQDRDAGVVPVGKMIVGMLLEEWLEELADAVSERTWINRESLVRVHIRPAIGSKQLAKLTHRDIHSLYRTKLAEGLAPSTVERIHVVLNQVINTAMRQDREWSEVDRIVEKLTQTQEAEVEAANFINDNLKGF